MMTDKQKLWKKNHPWRIKYWAAHYRCCGKTGDYVKRGIKCLITKDEVEFLWHRDKANKMKVASLDRIDGEGDYTLENCRFIEMSENYLPQKIKQLTLGGKLVAIHNSAKDASRKLNIHYPSICKTANHQYKYSGGFVWRWVKPEDSRFSKKKTRSKAMKGVK